MNLLSMDSRSKDIGSGVLGRHGVGLDVSSAGRKGIAHGRTGSAGVPALDARRRFAFEIRRRPQRTPRVASPSPGSGRRTPRPGSRAGLGRYQAGPEGTWGPGLGGTPLRPTQKKQLLNFQGAAETFRRATYRSSAVTPREPPPPSRSQRTADPS